MDLCEPQEYVEFLRAYPEQTQNLARKLRNRLVELLPDCIEVVWDATNTVGTAYGFTEKNRDAFLHLPTYTSYVNLGFNHGVDLHDSEKRLKGTGSKIRHLRLTDVSDLDDPYVQDLIRQAHETAVRSDQPVQPRTVVRVMEGPKRRPRPS
ncbi:MAG TPA: DUF1801 domain-containing protein [Fimbriimonadaceae bacterium]|nr:DUF1801 domain-containing protein [Fimbriimonadaceae bacterium]